MRNLFIKTMVVASLWFGGASVASSQNILGGILGNVADRMSNKQNGSKTEGSKVSDIYEGLTSIFQNSKVATADKIVGTWVYKEPAVVFESSSLLKQAGGKLVSTAIENKLNTVFNKYGIKAGKFKMTFDKKGNFTQAIAKKTVTGTYAIEGKNVKLTYSGGIQQIMGTTQIDGNSLLIVMDATKLLKFASAAGAMYNNSMLGTISSYLSGVEGMECGVRLEKSK